MNLTCQVKFCVFCGFSFSTPVKENDRFSVLRFLLESSKMKKWETKLDRNNRLKSGRGKRVLNSRWSSFAFTWACFFCFPINRQEKKLWIRIRPGAFFLCASPSQQYNILPPPLIDLVIISRTSSKCLSFSLHFFTCFRPSFREIIKICGKEWESERLLLMPFYRGLWVSDVIIKIWKLYAVYKKL